MKRVVEGSEPEVVIRRSGMLGALLGAVTGSMFGLWGGGSGRAAEWGIVGSVVGGVSGIAWHMCVGIKKVGEDRTKLLLQVEGDDEGRDGQHQGRVVDGRRKVPIASRMRCRMRTEEHDSIDVLGVPVEKAETVIVEVLEKVEELRKTGMRSSIAGCRGSLFNVPKPAFQLVSTLYNEIAGHLTYRPNYSPDVPVFDVEAPGQRVLFDVATARLMAGAHRGAVKMAPGDGSKEGGEEGCIRQLLFVLARRLQGCLSEGLGGGAWPGMVGAGLAVGL
ncbi:hypothetical protein CYMTET_44180 [Cymbomonas tetramitiformis]|uniref:Uncharacterized protein n=1 Tax=Cymbomonas tetramitiformis TaxID=36881 RepID=A0AAE0C0T3_9CHLO|nr:hypothetical protein CYMTET_44180 [Cymbomonas tetramitiformis]